jgi:hypothetical protein
MLPTDAAAASALAPVRARGCPSSKGSDTRQVSWDLTHLPPSGSAAARRRQSSGRYTEPRRRLQKARAACRGRDSSARDLRQPLEQQREVRLLVRVRERAACPARLNSERTTLETPRARTKVRRFKLRFSFGYFVRVVVVARSVPELNQPSGSFPSSETKARASEWHRFKEDCKHRITALAVTSD